MDNIKQSDAQTNAVDNLWIRFQCVCVGGVHFMSTCRIWPECEHACLLGSHSARLDPFFRRLTIKCKLDREELSCNQTAFLATVQGCYSKVKRGNLEQSPRNPL